jgi:hypothetical protein
MSANKTGSEYDASVIMPTPNFNDKVSFNVNVSPSGAADYMVKARSVSLQQDRSNLADKSGTSVDLVRLTLACRYQTPDPWGEAGADRMSPVAVYRDAFSTLARFLFPILLPTSIQGSSSLSNQEW